jgi:hypothetical protein
MGRRVESYGGPGGFLETPVTGGGRAGVYRQMAARHQFPEGDWAEFGCRSGATARLLIPLMPPTARFFAFDSFRGLPLDWNRGPGRVVPRGHFKCEQPEIEGATIVAGLFADTLPAWLDAEERHLALIHLDCDLYESARDVMERLRYGRELSAGSVILIDDLCSYPNWRNGIWKAVEPWLEGKPYRWLARGPGHGALVLE